MQVRLGPPGLIGVGIAVADVGDAVARGQALQEIERPDALTGIERVRQFFVYDRYANQGRDERSHSFSRRVWIQCQWHVNDVGLHGVLFTWRLTDPNAPRSAIVSSERRLPRACPAENRL